MSESLISRKSCRAWSASWASVLTLPLVPSRSGHSTAGSLAQEIQPSIAPRPLPPDHPAKKPQTASQIRPRNFAGNDCGRRPASRDPVPSATSECSRPAQTSQLARAAREHKLRRHNRRKKIPHPGHGQYRSHRLQCESQSVRHHRRQFTAARCRSMLLRTVILRCSHFTGME